MDDYEAWAKRWQMTSSGRRRPEFVGLTLRAAEETAADKAFKVRVFGPPTDIRAVFRANLDSNRLNLLVRDGMVMDTALG